MRSCHPLARGIGRILTICTVLALAPIVSGQRPTAAKADPEPQKVVILGASLSAGFICPFPDEDGEVGRTVKLKRALLPLWEDVDAEVTDRSDVMTFLSPVKKQTAKVQKAVAQKPDLVVGIDYLFWFGYGRTRGEDRAAYRLGQLEKGLALLEKFECPIVIGDFPDMTGADARMLRAAQIPSAETQKKLNARVHAWAKEREHVHVVPLCEWVAEMKSEGRTVTSEGRPVRLGPKALLQPDKLHPTKLGVAVVADAVRETLATVFDTGHALRADDVDFDRIVDAIGADGDLEDAVAVPASSAREK